jgi:glycosyltransferase involved in cell wall biosynthesis
VSLYNTASIYWHATGIDADLNINPEKAEHFGISVIEAMAAGCVPIVFAYGGPAEIVDSGLNGYCYRDINELRRITEKVIRQSADPVVDRMRAEARTKASQYSVQIFKTRWQDLIEEILTFS